MWLLHFLRLDINIAVMGGARRFPYPKWVWSPSGGWWPNPVNWKRNTAIYLGASFLICAAAGNWSNKNTVRHHIMPSLYCFCFLIFFHHLQFAVIMYCLICLLFAYVIFCFLIILFVFVMSFCSSENLRKEICNSRYT